MHNENAKKCYLIGEASLSIECGNILLQNGLHLCGVLSES